MTLQLRYLQTLREIGANQNSTVVFPMPIDLVKPMLDAMSTSANATPASDNGTASTVAPTPGQLPLASSLELGIGELEPPIPPAPADPEVPASRATGVAPDPAT